MLRPGLWLSVALASALLVAASGAAGALARKSPGEEVGQPGGSDWLGEELRLREAEGGPKKTITLLPESDGSSDQPDGQKDASKAAAAQKPAKASASKKKTPSGVGRTKAPESDSSASSDESAGKSSGKSAGSVKALSAKFPATKPNNLTRDVDVEALALRPAVDLAKLVQRMYWRQVRMERAMSRAGVAAGRQTFRSCKEIKSARPKAASGIFVISPVGEEKVSVYCDMTTDGGGWTSLLNPASFSYKAYPGLEMRSTVQSGRDPCMGTDMLVRWGAWNVIRNYRCGNAVSTSHYLLVNKLRATDVLLRATLQGQTTRGIWINGRFVGHSALTGAAPGQPVAATVAGAGAAPEGPALGACAFYSGQPWKSLSGVNQCTSIVVPHTVKPLVLRGWLDGKQDLDVKISAGEGGQPTADYGVGWVISSLMVR